MQLRFFVFIIITAASASPALRKFVDEGRRAGGGLKNDDLLIASKVRSNRFTDDKR